MKTLSIIIFLFCFLGIAMPSSATHIVGGEFELLHIEGFRYRLNLILYADEINMQDERAIDPYAIVHIWSKANSNQPIESKYLPLIDKQIVPYTNPDCVIPHLETSKTVYSAEILLDPAKYNNEAGYYINYERCCRNGVIDNIQRPGHVGQAFYLEFPAVVKNGKPFINSSPNLFPPLSDFARLGFPFYFDFSGTDADGDKLVYSLITPFAGSSSQDDGNVLPPARPAPYAPVLWAPGYGVNRMVPGNPSLHISQDGIIKVTPTQTGLFVFAVKAEEYRNGVKIGEVRREFQMLVYEYPGNDHPPVLTAKKANNTTPVGGAISLRGNDFPDFENNRCITLLVEDKDVDALNAQNNGQEPLSFRIKPVNFSGDFSSEFLSVTTGAVDKEKRSFELELCLPLCPPTDKYPYIFDIIASDNTCSVPLSDTLRVSVYSPILPENTPPETTSSLSSSIPNTMFIERQLGNEISFEVKGRDQDNDRVWLRAEGYDFSLEDYGMVFQELTGQGTVSSTFSWKPDCNNVQLPEKDVFTVLFITEDEDRCQFASPDTLTVNLKVNAPPNAAPSLTVADLDHYAVVAGVDSAFSFELRGTDANAKDLMSLQLDSLTSEEKGSMPAFSWENVEGSSNINGTLMIDPDCEIFAGDKTERNFTFHFSLKDNPCFTSLQDTLSLKVVFREKDLKFDQVKFVNVFTPNGDNRNDYFEIFELPEDACHNRLESITVVNRWGKVLFNTTDRQFRWDGENFPTGVYFYQVVYTQKTFRSSLSLVRGKALPPAATLQNP